MKSFRNFLKEKIEEDTPVGDLARDAFSKSAKWYGSTIESLMKNMKQHGGASRGAEDALVEAVSEYLAETGFNDDYYLDKEEGDDYDFEN